MSTTYGEWSTFNFTLAAPALPVVEGLALVNDTGTPGDLVTTDARISGSLTLADGSVGSLPVQYDWNNDGMVDGTVYSDMLGQFTIDLRSLSLPDGAQTVKIRGGRYLNGPMMPTYGDWGTFSFTYSVPPPALPSVGSLVLVNDTEAPGDLVTSDARVTGNLTLGDGSAAYLPVQYDLNADGIADGTVYADMMGQFTVDLRSSNLESGSQTIAFRGGRSLNGPMSTTYGTWSNFTFTLVAPVLPAVTNLSLVNDTGTAGDLITTDPRVTGTVTWAEGGVVSLPVQYDWNNDGMVDGTVYTDMMGRFTIDLQNVNLPEGSQTIKIRTGHTQNGPMFPTYGAWSTFGFTYSAPPPALPVIEDLSLVNDTGTPSDLITSDPRVTGTLTVTNASAPYSPVEYDFNGDGIADGTTQTDMMGQFTVDLRSANLAAGTYTVTMRGGRYLSGPMTPTFGDPATFTFTYVLPTTPPPENPPTNIAPVLQGLQLISGASAPGMPVTGNLTGTLTDSSVNSTYSLQIDNNGDGVPDTALSVTVGQVSANLTRPTGVSAISVRVVETESGTSNTLTSGWNLVPWVTNGPPVEGGPGPVVVDWNAIEQARQNAVATGIALDQAVVEMQAALQGIQATYIAEQQEAENVYTAAVAAADAEYTVAIQLASAAFDNTMAQITAAHAIELEGHEDAQAAAKAAAEAELFTDRAVALNEYNQAKLDAEAVYHARQAAADLVYFAAQQAATDAYQQAGEEIEDTLAAEEAAAAAVRAGELEAANLALNNALAAADAARDAAMAANQGARNSSFTSRQSQLTLDTAQFPSSWTYDVSSVQTDPAVVAAIDSANSSLQLAVGLADQAYDAAIDSAEGAYNSAITAAGTDLQSAWETAELVRLNARAAAATAYQTSVTAATSKYQTDVAKAATKRDEDKVKAAEAYDTSEAEVRATRNTALDAAWDTYTEAMNTAQSTLDGGLASDQTLYSGRLVPIRAAWNTSVTTASDVFNKSMNDAAQEYQEEMARQVDTLYDNLIGPAWSTLQGIFNGLSTAMSSAVYGAQYA